ncbi:MAG: EcsC family protein [Bdellovibrionaceae bacterium]|nr:EcsC family protein [Pseudobdellovibrionaceae bacterium]
MIEPALSAIESKTLDEAAVFFQDPGLVIQGLNFIGHPIEALQKKLPPKAQGMIQKASEAAIRKALGVALTTLPKETGPLTTERARTSDWLHRGLATVTGAAGGAFGLAAIPVELPMTTVLLLRGIADQARLAGLDLRDPEIQLECIMVFAMGSPSEKDDALNSSYFASRLAFSQLIQQAGAAAVGLSAKDLLTALDKGSMPVLVRLIAKVAETFQIRITQKAVSEAIPVIGAVGGGALNYAFAQYFVTAGKFHFAIRAMEKKYGTQAVQDELRLRMSRRVSA